MQDYMLLLNFYYVFSTLKKIWNLVSTGQAASKDMLSESLEIPPIKVYAIL